jgi:hypothetical protein
VPRLGPRDAQQRAGTVEHAVGGSEQRRRDLLVLPGERHGQRNPSARAYVSRRVTEFFAETL